MHFWTALDTCLVYSKPKLRGTFCQREKIKMTSFYLARECVDIPNVFLVKKKTKTLVLRNPSMWTSHVFFFLCVFYYPYSLAVFSLTLWGQEHDGETFKENHVLHGSKYRKWKIDELCCNEDSQIEQISKTWRIQFCNKVLKLKAKQYILIYEQPCTIM